MGTKNDPAPFDCYANAEPDEPMFILLARDPVAAMVVRLWVTLRAAVQQGTYHPDRVREDIAELMSEIDGEYHDPQLAEAMVCADAMEQWREANR